MHGLPGDDAGSLQLNSLAHLSDNGALAVNGITEGVDNSAQESLSNGNIDNGARPLDDITFLDLSVHHNGGAVSYEQQPGQLLTYHFPRRQYRRCPSPG